MTPSDSFGLFCKVVAAVLAAALVAPVAAQATSPERTGSLRNYPVVLSQSNAGPAIRTGRLVDGLGEAKQQQRVRNVSVQACAALGSSFALLGALVLIRTRGDRDRGRAGGTCAGNSAAEVGVAYLLAGSCILLCLTWLHGAIGNPMLLSVLGKDGFALLTMLAHVVNAVAAMGFLGGVVLAGAFAARQLHCASTGEDRALRSVTFSIRLPGWTTLR